jgi:predicted enzyme related to lactoylglutathione lyase
MDWKLELVAVPVSDVDRAKAFYVEQAGFVADHDHVVTEELRFVQLTPPGSACSIAIGTGITESAPGTAQVQLVVADIEEARAQLVARGVDAGAVQVFPWGSLCSSKTLTATGSRCSRFPRAPLRQPDRSGREDAGPGERTSRRGVDSSARNAEDAERVGLVVRECARPVCAARHAPVAQDIASCDTCGTRNWSRPPVLPHRLTCPRRIAARRVGGFPRAGAYAW